MSTLNKFGGNWTEKKIEIVEKYAKAYLKIMNKRNFKLIYFDGFAGCGDIEKISSEIIEGAASKILAIDEPRSFDIYYLVELEKRKAEQLKKILDSKFPNKNKIIQKADCNLKLIAMADYLSEHKNYRALAFVDPHGMQVNWHSIEVFKKLGVDMWLLIPTGIGVNRMLKRNGEISDSWMKKLIQFLGLTREEIMELFYKEHENMTLFGNEIMTRKNKEPIARIMGIYEKRLKTIWDHVSIPFAMTNSTGSIMFHFILASQNPNAKKIANDIIKKI
jgi:three-Cys-motif partner protein